MSKSTTQLVFTVDNTTAVGVTSILDPITGGDTDNYFLNETAIKAANGVEITQGDDTLTVSLGAGTVLLPGSPSYIRVAVPLLTGKQRYALLAATPGTAGPYSAVIPGLGTLAAGMTTGDLMDIEFVCGNSFAGTGAEGTSVVGTPELADQGLATADPYDDYSGADA